jgi:hypothetical protein
MGKVSNQRGVEVQGDSEAQKFNIQYSKFKVEGLEV